LDHQREKNAAQVAPQVAPVTSKALGQAASAD